MKITSIEYAWHLGVEYGVNEERERILKIIAKYRNKPSFGYANLIALIKGEQK